MADVPGTGFVPKPVETWRKNAFISELKVIAAGPEKNRKKRLRELAAWRLEQKRTAKASRAVVEWHHPPWDTLDYGQLVRAKPDPNLALVFVRRILQKDAGLGTEGRLQTVKLRGGFEFTREFYEKHPDRIHVAIER